MARDAISGEKTFVRGLGFCAFASNSNVTEVDVKDGKLLRIRPLHYDREYNPEQFRPWKIEARGKSFEAPLKSLIPPLSLSYKKRVYSPNRIPYPLKRVDFDPYGDRHTENRGKSGYVRISWDEALDIVSAEIKRVKEKYGPYAILAQADGHGETQIVHGPHGCSVNLLKLLGGYTLQTRNPDSWEGWWWGAKHVWGMEPVGLMVPAHNLIPDVAENSDLLLFWGCDAETTPWGWSGQISSRLCYWFTELGIKSIYICPDLNYAAGVHADKWIPIRPNTDAALQLAIAHVWITEGIYDREYVASHTIGFDKVKQYVLGEEDGVPKTPKWAAEVTGVPSRIIKALARDWAAKAVSIAHVNGGSYIRGPYSTEPARLEVILLAMQGLGKPGRHQIKMAGWGTFGMPEFWSIPRPEVMPDLHAAYRGWFRDMPKQFIPKNLIADAILNPPVTWHSATGIHAPAEDQFQKYTYPREGCSEIHMIWTDCPCLMECWNDGNRIVDAFRSEKIEFILAQHPWMENDCLFADIILPSNTGFEVEDIGSDNTGGQFNTLFHEEKCIEPVGESKSNYEIVCMIADRLGLLDQYTEGKGIEDWIRFGYEHSGVADRISFEELKEKGYYVVPTDPEWEKYRPGLIDFYEDPENNPLQTPSGKLEFYSQRLADHFPDDQERPPYPKWIPHGETHQESLLCERAGKYPLLLLSNHPRWRVHAQHDDVSWLREIPTCKIKGPDGYAYEPIWINPKDAASRGIENGDILGMYNERGTVLGCAYVTERIMPGVVSQDHGARYDPIVPGEIDRGGSNNTISPNNTTSKNATGMATSGFLVEVERINIEELKKKYPDAFKRPYHQGAGLPMGRVLVKGD
ncbi:MAG: molybdopterin-dependent oxidoreductase [Deltaproteobacteria bacterium]|nr:molybdopterin-dependent oxidoreductase [Deltaproteobacteria bacterium]